MATDPYLAAIYGDDSPQANPSPDTGGDGAPTTTTTTPKPKGKAKGKRTDKAGSKADDSSGPAPTAASDAAAVQKLVAADGGANPFAGLTPSALNGLSELGKLGSGPPIPEQVVGDVPETFGPGGALTVDGQPTVAGKALAGKGKAPAAAATKGPAPVSAAEQLMQGLVSQYQSAMNTVNPYINGQVAGADVNAATNMGTEIGGPTGTLTPSQQAAVSQSNSQLATDAKDYATANQAGATDIANALTDTGKANAEYLGVAPYLGILSALTSEAQYKTETGTPPASVTGSKLPPWLEQMYQGTVGSSGAAGGASAVGTGTGTAPAIAPSTSGTSSSSSTTPSTDTASVAGGGNA